MLHNRSEVKKSGLFMRILIDKGYLSSTYQLYLFNLCQVNPQTPKRANREINRIRQSIKKPENELKLCSRNYVVNLLDETM